MRSKDYLERCENDFFCKRDFTACVPRGYRAQSCIDSSRSSCEADDLHHHSIHPGARLVRYVSSGHQSIAQHTCEKDQCPQALCLELDIHVRLSCLYRMTKWNRKSTRFIPFFVEFFSDLNIKNLERQLPIKELILLTIFLFNLLI